MDKFEILQELLKERINNFMDYNHEEIKIYNKILDLIKTTNETHERIKGSGWKENK